MMPVLLPDDVGVHVYQCPYCTRTHTANIDDGTGVPWIIPVWCCGRYVEIIAATTSRLSSLGGDTPAALSTASTPPAAKRGEWWQRLHSLASWVAVGLCIGAAFCTAWAIAEWGWSR